MPPRPSCPASTSTTRSRSACSWRATSIRPSSAPPCAGSRGSASSSASASTRRAARLRSSRRCGRTPTARCARCARWPPAARPDTPRPVSEWIYFIHPPRENFAATMTDEERAVWGVHFERLQRLLAEGTLILAGPTLGDVNTGIAVFEAPDEETARRIMEEDPVFVGGFARSELRPFKVALLRGRE